MSAIGCDFNRSMQHFIFNGKMDRMQLKQKYRQGFTVAEKTEPWVR